MLRALARSLALFGVVLLAKSTYLNNQVMGWLRGVTFAAAPANVYVSLHTGDPGLTGANEHGATAAYGRKIIGYGAGNPASNAAIIEFNEATANYSAQITHFGNWDAASGGNFLGGAALTTPRTIDSGETPRFPAASLTWTES